MKKLAVLFFGVALFAVSCSKDYTCTCKNTYISGTNTQTNTSTTTFKSVTKSFVKNDAGCVSSESKDEKGVVTSKRECTIE